MVSGVDLPIYALCLIIIAMVIMFVAIIILIILLKKSKCYDSEYKVFTRPNTSTSLGLDKSDYQRQESNKELSSLKSTAKIISECENVKAEDLFLKHSCSIRNISNLETSLSTRDVNLPPRARKPVPTTVILPEQMMAICRDVLNKRSTDDNTPYKDIIENLHEFKKHDKLTTSGDKTNNMREKSMSTPDLDLYDSPPRKLPEENSTSNFDIYDCPPVRKPVEGQAINNEISNEDKMEADDNDIPLYDSLPSPCLYPKQNVIVDQDTQYLLALSGPAIEEPSYVNAKRNNYIL